MSADVFFVILKAMFSQMFVHRGGGLGIPCPRSQVPSGNGWICPGVGILVRGHGFMRGHGIQRGHRNTRGGRYTRGW